MLFKHKKYELCFDKALGTIFVTLFSIYYIYCLWFDVCQSEAQRMKVYLIIKSLFLNEHHFYIHTTAAQSKTII